MTISRTLSKDEMGHLLNPTRYKHHWLNTANRKRILGAIDNDSDTVELVGVSWKMFSLVFNDDRNTFYLSPTGKKSPFTPSAWLKLDLLRKEVAD